MLKNNRFKCYSRKKYVKHQSINCINENIKNINKNRKQLKSQKIYTLENNIVWSSKIGCINKSSF